MIAKTSAVSERDIMQTANWTTKSQVYRPSGIRTQDLRIMRFGPGSDKEGQALLSRAIGLGASEREWQDYRLGDISVLRSVNRSLYG